LPPVLIAGIVAAVLVMFLGSRFIQYLRDQEIGQFVRPQGLIPEGHEEKQGTPTMGGLLILVAMAVPFVILSDRSTAAMAVFGTTLACGAIGFADDLMKLIRRRSGGVAARWRMLALLAISAVLTYVAVDVVGIPTTLNNPFVNEHYEIGWVAFFVIVFLVVAGGANAVNLTDGLDGSWPTRASPSSATATISRCWAARWWAPASGSSGSTRTPPRCSWVIRARTPWEGQSPPWRS
jgi:phospho-N-acetylmuramoyl-pentapeptide-transferase